MNRLAVAYRAVICSVLVLRVTGSAETWVESHLKEVVLVTKEAGYEFSVKLDEKANIMKIRGVWNGVAFEVPETEYDGVGGVALVHAGVKVNSPYPQGAKKNVILVLPFGRSAQVDEKGKNVVMPDVIRLHFHEGKYVLWEKCVSKGDQSGKWALSFKQVGKEEVDNGEEKGVCNPYYPEAESGKYP